MASWPYHLVKFLSWLILRFGLGLEVRGQSHVPAAGAFIAASNHVSYLDPLVVGVACPRRLCFMARSTLYAHPLMRGFLRAMQVIPLQRGEADVWAVREATRQLTRGQPVAIFPEGGRQVSGILGQAKRGVGLVAALAEVPIVPVFVHGTSKALPPGSRWPRRAKIQVAFGPQIAYTGERFSATSAPSSAAGTIVRADSSHRVSVHRSMRHQALADAVTQSWRRLKEEVEQVRPTSS
mgnify:CR=1 FL=1